MKKIISTVLAMLITLHTIVFANPANFNSPYGRISKDHTTRNSFAVQKTLSHIPTANNLLQQNSPPPVSSNNPTIAATTPINNPYRYAGYEYLETVELYDLNARYYNPQTARFLSQDPYYNLGNRVIGLYEINVPTAASIMQANALYAYCGNNPVRYNDPTGELFGITISILTIIKVASVVAGAAAAAYTAYQSHKYTGKIDWEATIFNGLSWGMMAYTLGMSAYAVYVDYCHYYGKTPVTEVKFNSQATIPTNEKASKNAETVTTNTRGESVPRINKESPIRIPKDATITPQQKNGYYQIKHNWTDDGYKYEARWHTQTPNAPRSQGDTWVVTRTTPGTPGNEKQVHYYTQSGWVSQTKWDEAIKARNAGTATTEQLELLASGHWPG